MNCCGSPGQGLEIGGQVFRQNRVLDAIVRRVGREVLGYFYAGHRTLTTEKRSAYRAGTGATACHPTGCRQPWTSYLPIA